jgi:hypothetical protein
MDLERCPRGHQGTLRLIAALTYGPISRRILTPLRLAAAPPPIASARLEQAHCAWASAYHPLLQGERAPSWAKVRPVDPPPVLP